MSSNPWDTVKLPMMPEVASEPAKKEAGAATPAKPAPTAAPAKPASEVRSAAKPGPTAPPPPPAPPAPKPLDVAGLPAVEVCKRFTPGAEALALAKPDLRLVAYLQLLTERQLYVDAVQLLAHALPKREAVWWACRCVADGSEGENKEPSPALKAARAWVVDPSESKRRAAETAAEATQYATPAGCAALAAFVSGGSLAPASAPLVPPGPWLTAQAVANAVQLAALGQPARAAERYQQFLTEGLAVVKGT
jgi:hypothetical protein